VKINRNENKLWAFNMTRYFPITGTTTYRLFDKLPAANLNNLPGRRKEIFLGAGCFGLKNKALMYTKLYIRDSVHV
jgi:hypothetical protein